MERVELEQWKGREVARLLALVESERRYYQEIVAAIPVGLLVLSHDLSVVSSNRAVRKLFGVRSGDSIKGPLESLLPAQALQQIQGVFQGGETIQNLTVEHEGRTLRISALAIRNGDEEHPYEALLSIEDVTDLTRGVSARAVAPPPPPPATAAAAKAPDAEKQPAPTEAVELLENLEAVIWAVEISSMNFLFVTNTAEEVLGYSPDHWLNTPNFWAERIESEDRDAIVKSYREAIANRRRHSCEFRARAADGRTLWLRETARILTDAQGKPQHLIGLTIDITERRQIEEEHVRAERMDALHKLSSRLSHDLNNVLMIVKGYGEELLNNIAKNDPLRADVQEILSATERISGLTGHLLAFTRRQASAAETFDVSEMLNALEGALKQAAGPKVTLELRPDAGLQAKAARPQLEQLLTGLATRAGASMRNGGKLTVAAGETEIVEELRRSERTLGPGRYATVTVEDTDGMLSHEAQMALFEGFLPARDAAETSAIVSRGYTFVRQWGGDIAVASTPQGTRITVFLPFAGRKEIAPVPPPMPVQAVVAPPAELVETAKAMETILVVEDEGGIRALVRKILRRQGYTVIEASNGEEAMKFCRENAGKIDLLITDMMMPNMGGRELAEALKAHCQGMKVLYVSGYTDDATVYSGDFPPGTAFLQKPFTLGSLLDKVKEVLAEQ